MSKGYKGSKSIETNARHRKQAHCSCCIGKAWPPAGVYAL